MIDLETQRGALNGNGVAEIIVMSHSKPELGDAICEIVDRLVMDDPDATRWKVDAVRAAVNAPDWYTNANRQIGRRMSAHGFARVGDEWVHGATPPPRRKHPNALRVTRQRLSEARRCDLERLLERVANELRRRGVEPKI